MSLSEIADTAALKRGFTDDALDDALSKMTEVEVDSLVTTVLGILHGLPAFRGLNTTPMGIALVTRWLEIRQETKH